eukprot:TRINITY_DN77404_c0_g1_i1.p1 TRINITY_DN77404_c0_g1~~TRINITY_DN77404_c0_g1_i1.p1  ORF type:complete len:510 (-),score=69.51 TRINITY_DN77404_c0_g1_i1:225-1700(-)
MASYIIAGKAGCVSFARNEYVAKMIEAACPGVFFHFEMKHPDMWEGFINDVFRKYDFDGFPENFEGPLIWTHEGDLIGNSAEFMQKVCVEKFGISDIPSVTDPRFKQIASDNLKQIKLELHRKANGPAFSEQCEMAATRARDAGLLDPQVFEEQRRLVVSGASFEVWISATLADEREKLRESYKAGDSPAIINPELSISTAGTHDSHLVVLHPRPLVWKHLVLPKRRLVQEVMIENVPETKQLELHSCTFRSDPGEDLQLEDFVAAMEVLVNLGGVATWMGLKGGTEYRHTVDTHLQILPFPILSGNTEDSPLRFPLDRYINLALADSKSTLPCFPFPHTLSAITLDGESKNKAADLARTGLAVFETARGRQRDSCLLAFTATWLLLVPLQEPPEAGSLHHDAWLRLPPPPPCALVGVVIAEAIEKDFPETTGSCLIGGQGQPKLVSNRAEQENIPEGSEAYTAALHEARISSEILKTPAGYIGVWALSQS